MKFTNDLQIINNSLYFSSIILYFYQMRNITAIILLSASVNAMSIELPSCHGKDYCEIYEVVPPFYNGVANIQFPNGGTYFYSNTVPAPSWVGTPVVMGVIRRTQWQFFAPDEEEALLQLKDKKLAEIAKKNAIADRKAYLKQVSRYDWPKILLKNGQLCVPELASSEAKDWKKHLICTNVDLSEQTNVAETN